MKGGTTVSSDLTKVTAAEIAGLASLGLITSLHSSGLTRKWRLTGRGLVYLESLTS